MFKHLAGLGITVMRFASTDIEEIGIHENVRGLFDCLEWGNAFYSDWKTHPQLTLEFLSTLEVKEPTGN